MTYSLEEARHAVITTALRLKKSGLIVRSDGNISARISANQFVITPTKRDFESLRAEDIVIVNISNGSHVGNVLPSSEHLVHLITYKLHPATNFIVHTHQPAASALSILGRDFSDLEQYFPKGMTKEIEIMGRQIPTAEYGPSGSKKLMKAVGAVQKKYPGADSILMKNHGILCFGTTAVETYHKAEIFEKICEWIYSDITGVEWEELQAENLYDIKYRRKLSWSKSCKWLSSQVSFFITSPFVVRYGLMSEAMKPYLDDVARLIGKNIKNVNLDNNQAGMEKILRNTPAMLLKGKGAICTGADAEEARAISMILENGAMAAYLAAKDPDAVPLSEKIAEEERKSYLNSYSKRHK